MPVVWLQNFFYQLHNVDFLKKILNLLVNRSILASGIDFYDTKSACFTVCPPPNVKLFSITIWQAPFTPPLCPWQLPHCYLCPWVLYSTYEQNYLVHSFSQWLISLRIVFSRSIHVAANSLISRKTWSPPKCPAIEDSIRKMWYTYTMECYSVIT